MKAEQAQMFGEIYDVSAKHKKCSVVRLADLKPHSLEPRRTPTTDQGLSEPWRGRGNTTDSKAMNFQNQTPPLSMYFAILGKSLHSFGLNFLVCERGKLKKIINKPLLPVLTPLQGKRRKTFEDFLIFFSPVITAHEHPWPWSQRRTKYMWSLSLWNSSAAWETVLNKQNT